MAAPDRLPEFEALALPLLPDLYRTAMAMTQSDAAATELVRETYVQAWKSRHRFGGGSDDRVRFFQLSFQRIHHRQNQLPPSTSLHEGREDSGAPAPGETRLSHEGVLMVLQGLSPDDREVLLLTDVEQFTCREVAAILDVPMGTVMPHLSRVRAKLLAVLDWPPRGVERNGPR